ncbi:MAG: cytochrome c maturation protein CcmE [Calditrichaeota bacterium]|nr:MAG: cytochrome c maturation protein CcmE [Calditrichota bacterium]
MSMAAKRLKIAFSFAVVAGLLAWLTVSGFDQNMQYYVKIKEIKAMGSQAQTRGLRVKGFLVPGSLVRTPNSLQVRFVIEDEGEQMEVHYARELPDTFRDGSEVLVEGKYRPEGYFEAQTLMAKCPSKYEAADGYDADMVRDMHPGDGTN